MTPTTSSTNASGLSVHKVTSWVDEGCTRTPWCGADENDTDVWGCRTIYDRYVTCPECLRKMKENTDAQQ